MYPYPTPHTFPVVVKTPHSQKGDYILMENWCHIDIRFQGLPRKFLKDIVYFKDNIKYVRRNDLDVNYIDCTWLEFKVPKYSIEHYISRL